MMVTITKDYVTLDPDDNDADFRYGYGPTMIAQFKQDLYNREFSLQDQGKDDEIDPLQNRFKFWINIIDDTVVQYLMIFLNMIITTKEWIILFVAQRYFLRLED